MKILSRLIFGFLIIAVSFVAPAGATNVQRPFDAKAFSAAQAAGEPVLIEIHADWCPTCRAQLPILNKLSGEANYSRIHRFRVDFDSQKDLVKHFGARMQSTLVLFKGSQEMARSVGETDERAIRAMLKRAL